MTNDSLPMRFLVILVVVGMVHAAIGGALWSWSRGGEVVEADPPQEVPATGQAYQVQPPDTGGTVSPPPPPPSQYATYVVRPGESYWGIASRYKTTVGELQRINGHKPNHVLQPGDSLKVPRN